MAVIQACGTSPRLSLTALRVDDINDIQSLAMTLRPLCRPNMASRVKHASPASALPFSMPSSSEGPLPIGVVRSSIESSTSERRRKRQIPSRFS
ncbi:hypothetical protein D3C72_2261090 [compost metagenome]